MFYPEAGFDELIEFAHELADKSQTIIRPYYRALLTVYNKLDNSPVTEADKQAEQVMRDLIMRRYPEHGIIGEEYDSIHVDESDWLWSLDPIDGTKSFVIGSPLFGSLIGLLYKKKPILGIINQPILNERWVGISGKGTFFNDEKIQTRPIDNLSEARFSYTSPHMFTQEQQQKIETLSQQVNQTTFGGDCYAYGLLASGYTDIIIEASLHQHDYMALAPVIENAGGVITDWAGEKLTLQSDGKVMASANSKLHEQVLRILT